jgi:hypothetical protein
MNKLEKTIIKIGIGLLLIGGIVGGIKEIKRGTHPEQYKRVKIERLQR